VTGHGGRGDGVVFTLDFNGDNFAVLHHFLETPDGDSPTAGLLLVGDTLFGTTFRGGLYDDGTVFAITVPEPTHLAAATVFLTLLIVRFTTLTSLAFDLRTWKRL
jgi:uncharacterized repeat protein (TIGR03803 family)